MASLQPDFIDSYGKLDILDTNDEEFTNIVFETKDRKQEIVGIDLNTLLLGLFRIFGKKSFGRDDFPCDVTAWEGIVEPTFIYLTHIVPISDILSRILILNRNLSSAHEDSIFGAIEFLIHWVGQFGMFLHSQHFLAVYSFATSEIGFFLNIEDDIETYNLDRQLMNRFLLKLERLRQISEAAMTSHAHDQLLWDPILNVSRSGPQILLTEGSWDGQMKAEIKEQLKKALQDGPKIKLEIFGGEALLDSDSDDEESNASEPAVDDDNNNTTQFPLVRIGPGVSLLDSIAVYAQSLLDIDLLELARQWTLLDTALYQRLSWHAILRSCINAEDDPFASNKLLQDTMDFGGVKRLVDRFNSASTWVTSVVLSGDSPVHRGLLITKFIGLAQHLQHMGNFLGLMAVLTALQQGCISRMTLSMETVSPPAMQQLAVLKRLMAAGKNYSNYRAELLKLQAHLPFEKAQERVFKQQKKVSQLRKNASSNCTDNGRSTKSNTSSTARSEDQTLLDWRSIVHPKVTHYIQSNTSSSYRPTDDSNGFSANTAASGVFIDDDLHFDPHLQAVVPHFPAHIAALTAIAEVHASEYVPDQPHLFHVTKWRQIAAMLLPLARLQILQYDYQPVRIIGASLQYNWKRYLTRSTVQSTALSKKLYHLSESVESAEMIRRGLGNVTNHSNNTANSSRNHSSTNRPLQSAMSPKGKKTVTLFSGNDNNHNNIAEPSNSDRMKFQKSDAYDRIKRSSATGSMMSSIPSSQNLHAASPSGIGPGQLKRQPSRFTRMLSSVFSRRANDDDDEEEDEDDDEEDEEEEDDEEDDEEEDDDESDGESKKKKKLRFKSLLKAISFRK